MLAVLVVFDRLSLVKKSELLLLVGCVWKQLPPSGRHSVGLSSVIITTAGLQATPVGQSMRFLRVKLKTKSLN